MAAIKNIDVRKGMVILMDDGQLYRCLDRDLNTPGNWRAILNLKLCNLKTGVIKDHRVKPDDKVDLAFLEQRDMTYSYRDGDNFIFMDSESYEQLSLSEAFVGEQMKFLRENDPVKVIMYEGKALGVELPATITQKVIETEPSIKGATAAAQYKAAVTETGLKLNVPSFIEQGELIEIDTSECKYLRRAGGK